MKEMRRVLALVLCLVMLIGIVPAAAFATESEAPAEESGYTDLGTKTAAEGNEQQDPLPEEIQQLVGAPADAPALAADGETPIDAAILFSDLHTNSSIYKEGTVTGIMTALKNSDLPFSTVTSCGDAFSVNDNSGMYKGYTSTITGYIQGVFAGIPVNYVWSDHDRYAVQEDGKTLLDNDSGFIYGAGADGTYGTADDGNYYIFELSMADLSTNNRYNADFHSNSEVTANIAAFVADAAKLDKTKPLFIASHQPLLDNRNDNGHALEWCTAINEVAKNMDVAFFFGHNHKYDVAGDYYYAKGSTMSVCKDSAGNAQDVKINFTHMCAGYMEPTSTGSYDQSGTRRGVAVAAVIYEDSVKYVTYDSKGVYNGSYALNETVTRDHAAPAVTLTSIAVTTEPTTVEYTVGDTFSAEGLVVTGTYSDGTTVPVTGYTLSEVDMTTAGTKTVTVTYQGKTATFTITVAEHEVEEPEVTEQTFYSADNFAAVTATATNAVLEAVEEDAAADALLSFWYGYDISLEGQVEGTDTTVTLWLDAEAMDSDDFAVYYLNEEGQYVPVTGYELDVDEDEFEFITIHNAPMGRYVYGTPNTDDVIPEGAVLESLTVTPPAKTKYFDTDSEEKEVDGQLMNIIALESEGMVVVANYTHGADKYTVELDWNQFGTLEEGYALTFEPLVAGQYGSQTVTVSYGDVSATFTVWVCPEQLTIEGEETVVVDFDAPSVVDMTVAKIGDEAVLETVAKTLEGLVTGALTVYDFTPTYANGDTALSGKASVTLPIPEGVERPAVYYVSDDGRSFEKMPTTVNAENGTVTFTTEHFSRFVVAEDGTQVELKSEDARVEATTSTVSQDVWVLVDTLKNGGEYIIASVGEASRGYILGQNNQAQAHSGVLKIGDTESNRVYFISTDVTGTVWTATGNDAGWQFRNTNGTYLGYAEESVYVSKGTKGWRYTYDEKFDAAEAPERGWIYQENELVQQELWVFDANDNKKDSKDNFYLSCSDNDWRFSTNSGEVFFYEKQNVQMDTSTPGHTYSVEVTDILDQIAIADRTVNLTSRLKDTSTTGQVSYPTDWDVVYSVEAKGTPGVATLNADGTAAILTGTAGTAVIRATYTNEDGLIAYAEFAIVARPPVYSLEIENVPADSKMMLGSTYDLNAQGDMNGIPQTATVAWTVENGTGKATVNGNGVVTPVSEGTVTVTATWTENGKTYASKSVTLEIVDADWAIELCAPVDGSAYTKATAYQAGTQYYVLRNGTYEAVNITAFAEGVDYYTMNVITAPVVIKNVKNEQLSPKNVWAIVTRNGIDLGDLEDEELIWTSSNTDILVIDPTTGEITLKGEKGTAQVSVAYYIYDIDDNGNVVYTYEGETIYVSQKDADGKPTAFVDGNGNQVTVEDSTRLEKKVKKVLTDTVIYSISNDDYFVPEDGTDDFPEYPAQGSVRFDKTATAVGNYSETGIAMVELSMTGVPIKQGTDVIIMLDTSSSMTKNNVTGTNKTRAKVLEESLAKLIAQLQERDADGNYMDIKVAIADFNGYYGDGSGGTSGTPYDRTSGDYVKNGNSNGSGYQQASEAQVYTGTKALNADAFVAVDKLAATYTLNYTSGTNYDYAFDAIYQLGTAIKAANTEDRELIVVFMSDGASLQWNYFGTQNTYTKWNNWLAGSWKAADLTTSNLNSTAHSYFYDLNDHDGDGHINEHRMANAIKGDPNTRYEIIRKSTAGLPEGTLVSAGKDYLYTVPGLGATMYTINFDAKQDGQITVDNIDKALSSTASDKTGTTQYYYKVTSADQLETAFENIGHAIIYAAKNVVVEDKIGDKYTVNFGLPNKVTAEMAGMSEFYIQAVEYKLDANKERTGDPTVLENFTFNPNGTFKSHTVNGVACTSCGHVTTTDGVITGIDGTYFDYSSESKTDKEGKSFTEEYLHWNNEKLGSTELALQYFAYLDHSADAVGTANEVPAGTYYTNEYATLTYKNYKGNSVQQKFPKPQMTWNGAQVSYVFYLVNEKGQPVNRAGRVVPFAEAQYVTDVHTTEVIWNDLEQAAGLEAEHLADVLVPTVYALYDDDASYKIHVYEDEKKVNLNNHFVIGGDVTDEYNTSKDGGWTNAKTTYVFNNKSDAYKYTVVGAYSANESGEYLCKGEGTVTATIGLATDVTAEKIKESAYYTKDVNGKYILAAEYVAGTTYYTITAASYQAASGETQWTPDVNDSTSGGVVLGNHVYYIDENSEVYTIVRKNDAAEVHTGFDFHNTTVAFAVVWKPELVEDTVVIDYGLDVVIDVIKNDNMAAGVVGVRMDKPNTAINSGTYTAAKAQTVDVYIDSNNDSDKLKENKIGTASVENMNQIRFSLDKTNGMQLTDPAVFYYEADVNYYDTNNELKTTSMYSSVTVIPATTVYYEDSFVTLSSYSLQSDGKTYKLDDKSQWVQDGKTINATQDVDRPGADIISEAYDADNPYGYDSAYENCSTFSMGSAKRIDVTSDVRGEATFSFYGTGFDVISLTSNTSGTLIVEVTDTNGNVVKSGLVDTYYGYSYDETTDEWKAVTSEDSNALYQVPVIKFFDMPYGKYNVKLVAGYNKFFDHTAGESDYTLWLDAIRIYDPCGLNEVVDDKGTENKEDDVTVGGIYGADREYNPDYYELRDEIISAKTFGSFFEKAEGISEFNDSLTYYTLVNNEYVIAEEFASGVEYYTMNPNITIDGIAFVTSTFIDGISDTTSISDYTNFGPNNELYLAKGQAVAAEMNYANADTIQLGIKTVGGTGSVEVYGIKDGKKIYAVQQDISTSTDMYYDITALNGMTLVIRNSALDTAYEEIKDENGNVTAKVATKGAIVSITNIKVTDVPVELTVVEGEPGEEMEGLTVNSNTARAVMMSLRPPVVEEQPNAPEGGEPGGNEPGGEPEGGEPGGNEPGGEPEGGEPGGNEPGGDPEGGEPGGDEPGGDEPGGNVPQDPAPSEPVPEETEPEEKESVEETIQDIVEIIRDIIGIIGGLFRGWF